MSETFNVINPRNGNIPHLIIAITHYLCNLVISEFDGTEKLMYEVGELRAISGHMLGAAGVQIPENNLDHLYLSNEEDGAFELLDPRDVLGSKLLEHKDFAILIGTLGFLV
ncbi:hypothetical protein Tco_0525086 [Tanacetum coccineum]